MIQMHKTDSNCLKMLVHLRKNGRTKLKELSKEFKVDEKTIRRWGKILVDMGYAIDTKGGPYGGYLLIEETLTEDEWLRIKEFDINIYNKLSKILINRV